MHGLSEAGKAGTARVLTAGKSAPPRRMCEAHRRGTPNMRASQRGRRLFDGGRLRIVVNDNSRRDICISMRVFDELSIFVKPVKAPGRFSGRFDDGGGDAGAIFELWDEGIREFFDGGGDDDDVEGCACGPTFESVVDQTAFNFDVFDFEALQVLHGDIGEVFVDIHGVDEFGGTGEDCGHVTRASADFEDDVCGSDFKRGNEPGDIGEFERDLFAADGEHLVFVGAVTREVSDEEGAWRGLKGFERGGGEIRELGGECGHAFIVIFFEIVHLLSNDRDDDLFFFFGAGDKA